MTKRFKNIRTWLIAGTFSDTPLLPISPNRVLGCQIPALIGAVLLYTLPRENQRGLLGSYYIVQTVRCLAVS